jgi:spore coat polysaccharide biosynthesis predicted glycosyltransferase SpsG
MKNIRAAFFTEAGHSRGMGHLIRSFAISEKFKSLGVETSFFLDSNIFFDGKFKEITYFDWSEFDISNNYDIIFIDSYEADISVYQKIANACKVAVYVDDFKRLDYPEGVILNFSPDAGELFYKDKEEKHRYLLGLKYLPIRDELVSAKRAKKKKMFIMLGGSDVANLSLDLIDALKDIEINKLIISNDNNVVNNLEKYEDVEALYKPSDAQLVKAMASSSVAISTASMGAYELAYFKIPTIIVAVAKNQEAGISQFIKHNLASGSISIKNNSWKGDVKNKIEFILEKNNRYIDNAIDGNGTSNIVNEVLELAQ